MMAKRARRAKLFAQLSVDSVQLADGDAESGHNARVEGAVVRVFAGDPHWLGRKVTCLVPVLVEGDQPPPSGTMWSKLETVQAARFLEAVLSPVPSTGELEVVLGMCTPVPAPTDAPVEDYRAWADPPRAGPVRELADATLAAGLGVVLAVLFVGGGFAGLAWALWLLLR